jgi:hypothetical protein
VCGWGDSLGKKPPGETHREQYLYLEKSLKVSGCGKMNENPRATGEKKPQTRSAANEK